MSVKTPVVDTITAEDAKALTHEYRLNTADALPSFEILCKAMRSIREAACVGKYEVEVSVKGEPLEIISELREELSKLWFITLPIYHEDLIIIRWSEA